MTEQNILEKRLNILWKNWHIKTILKSRFLNEVKEKKEIKK